MRRIDLIKFNAELLQKMQSCGIKINDWQYVNLYNDYEEMLACGTKKTAISLILAEKYNLSESISMCKNRFCCYFVVIKKRSNRIATELHQSLYKNIDRN